VAIAAEIEQSAFPALIRRFLYDQIYPDNVLSSSEVPLAACPYFAGKIHVRNSAVATFYAPSDPSGSGGMRREQIRAVPSWRKGPPRYDCVLLSEDPDIAGMPGMSVVRVLLFFSFSFSGKTYPCALVHWYTKFGNGPDRDTGQWIVQPEFDPAGDPVVSIIHLDCVIRAAHLIGIFGENFVPKDLRFHQTLDAFNAFYVNKFIDHHAFDLLTPDLH
jgi:hypothetical protein